MGARDSAFHMVGNMGLALLRSNLQAGWEEKAGYEISMIKGW